jgi:hypothetical protein
MYITALLCENEGYTHLLNDIRDAAIYAFSTDAREKRSPQDHRST